jgi:zinc and cadmium transporter
MCPVGAFLFWSGASLGGTGSSLAGWALAFSAGVFLCISLSDLLPEMEFHSHNRVRLTLALLLGIAIAWGIGLVEGAGAHRHDHSDGQLSHPAEESHAAQDDHAGHTHSGAAHQH